jgi:hypothetical protein
MDLDSFPSLLYPDGEKHRCHDILIDSTLYFHLPIILYSVSAESPLLGKVLCCYKESFLTSLNLI